jgi:methylmalonyl-CoA/ethylmalonyl-CoA epimerase
VTVGDLDRAIAFYRDTLGMKLLFQVPNMAFFDCGGVRLMLGTPEKPGQIFSSVIYYKVDDIQRSCKILASRGVEFEAQPHLIAKMPDHDLWMAFLRDPDRNLLGLMCEVRSS